MVLSTMIHKEITRQAYFEYIHQMKSLFSTLTALLLASLCYAQLSSQDVFWDALQELCGKAFRGAVINAPENDTVFSGKDLVIHIRACDTDRIRIPLVVGDDRSRTWILTRSVDQLSLKHDHRHADGAEDRITQYGGKTSNTGSATLQVFPADQHTTDLLPPAASNVWWIELVPGSHLTYSLRRLGTDRFFSIRFDLTNTVNIPDAPWGWKE